MLLRFSQFPAGLLLLLAALPTSAVPPSTSIQYTVVPVGGNVYRYVYSITNNAAQGGTSVQLFDILFDTTLYDEPSLQIVTPSGLHTQWSEILLNTVGVDVPALYDALSLTGGIPPGSTVSGFSVQFTWLGPGTPGSQPFQVYDPNTFQLLQTGQSTAIPSPVPTPATSTVSLLLIAAGLLLTASYRLMQKPRNNPQPLP